MYRLAGLNVSDVPMCTSHNVQIFHECLSIFSQGVHRQENITQVGHLTICCWASLSEPNIIMSTGKKYCRGLTTATIDVSSTCDDINQDQ